MRPPRKDGARWKGRKLFLGRVDPPVDAEQLALAASLAVVPGRVARQEEHRQQVALFEAARMGKARYPALALLFAVPNGARTGLVTAKKLKAEGLRRGVPDIVLPVSRSGFGVSTAPKRFHGLFLELKAVYLTARSNRPGPRTYYGEVGEDQVGWAKALIEEGYAVAFAWGTEAGFQVLTDYLDGKFTQRDEPWKRLG